MPEDRPEKKPLDIEPVSRPALVFWIAWAAVLFIVGAITIHIRTTLSTTLAERDALRNEAGTVEKHAKEADELKKDIGELDMAVRTAQEFRGRRYEWGKILDHLVDVIPAHIRLESIEGKVIVRRLKGGNLWPTIEMDCISEGTDERNISRFRRKIINSPLWKDVRDMPEWPYREGRDSAGLPVLQFRAVLVLWPDRVRVRGLPAQVDPGDPRVFQRRGRRDPFR